MMRPEGPMPWWVIPLTIILTILFISILQPISIREPDPKELYKDILTEEEIKLIGKILPGGEYGSWIHTIEEIQICEITGTLWPVAKEPTND